MTVTITNLTFNYNGQPILKGIDFTARRGERWGIIGRNGAGKSTLIRCMAGLEKGVFDSIAVDGESLNSISQRSLAQFIAYVPQIHSGIYPFSVREYVMMGRFPYQGLMSIPSKQDKRIVDDALAIVGMSSFADRRMYALSGGEMQRVFLAGAVAQQAGVLLLDEPGTFLDPYHQELLQKALDRIHDEFKTTIVTVTHDINDALGHYSKILALVDGSVYFKGPSTELMADSTKQLKEIYGVTFTKINDTKRQISLVIPSG
ncbi:MAG: ATP-binding cassette domain-containing protein [Chitinivibrionales bacterium]|nr:ATP-binding cassette domain-containing protein [Chitinivibrionales bacterium]